MELDFERCYRAVDSRDQRFDGWFYTAVKSTGIYCRPSCPAMTPKPENVTFFPSAAAAQRAGFRACKRCRPDAAPGSPEWDVRADLVGRAMRLIGDGVVDREGVPGLASRLGYTERHLNRMLTTELGAGPLALARAQRAQTARILIETTDLGLADIAFAAGFGSVRQFNDTIQEVYAQAPGQLRERRPVPRAEAGTINLRLAYRSPLHIPALLDFLELRALPGVEERDGDTYRRGLSLPHGSATVALTPADRWVSASLRLTDVRDLAPAVARCRRLFDLDADPEAVDATLGADPALSAAIETEPGVRVPRAVDGFEMAVRAVVGQQVSVAGARTTLTRMIRAAGGFDGPDLVGFPAAAAVAELAGQRVRDAGGPAADDPAAGRGGRRRQDRPGARRGPGRVGGPADRAARDRRVDRRLRGDARDRRPGRVPAHRPGGAPRRGRAGPAVHPEGARGARRTLAAMAFVRPDPAVAGRLRPVIHSPAKIRTQPAATGQAVSRTPWRTRC